MVFIVTYSSGCRTIRQRRQLAIHQLKVPLSEREELCPYQNGGKCPDYEFVSRKAMSDVPSPLRYLG
jgi:hypothetical protein